MANPKTLGDLFFEDYCALNGYDPEHGVNWRERFGVDTEKDPDYLVERVGDRAIVEVKNFETRRMKERLLAAPGQVTRFGGRELYGTLRRSIWDGAAEQLAPFASLGIPLIVVVSNPLRSDVDLDPDDVVSAVLGEVKWLVDPSPRGRVQPVFSENGAVVARDANGDMVNCLPHLSAVVALCGLKDYPRVDVYDLSGAPGFTGTSVPRTMFDGEDDNWLGFIGESRFARLADRS